MGFKEFQESFKKKYRNEDLYLLFNRQEGKTTADRIRKEKNYCRIVITNKAGDKLKFINGGAVISISDRSFMSNRCEYEKVFHGEAELRLVPLKRVGVDKRINEIILEFYDNKGGVIPNDLYEFCDMACLEGRYVSEGSLASDVLIGKERCKILSERQIVTVEKILNETIHARLKEKLGIEREESYKQEIQRREKLKKQTLDEMLDKERDF